MTEWTESQIDAYVARWGEDPTNHWVVEEARIAPDAAVLDIGCGTGAALRHLAEAGHRGVLTGADRYARMIEHAERLRGPAAIAFVTAPAERLPFADATFDVALAINSVHHWDDIDAGLAEMARVLRPGGRFVWGGEAFGPDILPEGQDYAPRLAALGFDCTPVRPLGRGPGLIGEARRGA